MEAWIAGATGLVGRALVAELSGRIASGTVTALVRRSEGRKVSHVEERIVDFDRLEHELSGLAATHALCCLGTTIAKAGSQEAFRRVDFDYPLAFARAARAAGVRKFLIVTALGADPKSSVFYNRVKGEIEQALARLELPELHVFRPSLLLGEREERRPAERLAMALAKPVGALLFGPLKKYRAVDGSAVARAMASVALDERSAPGVTFYESDQIAAYAGRKS
jgi:uncharacterized protein YbjT (DUF2867 family)